MILRIIKILNSAITDISKSSSSDELEKIRIDYLGPKGHLPNSMLDMRDMNSSDRKEMGLAINSAKKTIETELNKKKNEFSEAIH